MTGHPYTAYPVVAVAPRRSIPVTPKNLAKLAVALFISAAGLTEAFRRAGLWAGISYLVLWVCVFFYSWRKNRVG